MADKFFILRFREMQYTGKGDPIQYDYIEVARSPDIEFLNSLVEKYRLNVVDPGTYISDGYEIVTEEIREHADYDYIVKHSDRKHVRPE